MAVIDECEKRHPAREVLGQWTEKKRKEELDRSGVRGTGVVQGKRHWTSTHTDNDHHRTTTEHWVTPSPASPVIVTSLKTGKVV